MVFPVLTHESKLLCLPKDTNESLGPLFSLSSKVTALNKQSQTGLVKIDSL